MEKPTKCERCKKRKPEEDFNDIDFGYGVYRKAPWCKVCSNLADKEYEERKKKWLKAQKIYAAKCRAERIANGATEEDEEKRKKEFNIVGRVIRYDYRNGLNGKMTVICEGFPQTEEWVKKENEKLAYPFGWARK